MRRLTALLTLLLVGCSEAPPPAAEEPAASTPAEVAAPEPTAATLDNVLAAQDTATQARYTHRHPKETLEFFGIQPGMTVVEALPGGGWYTKILMDYLGQDGTVIGANYAPDLWPNFSFMTEERLASLATWTTDWAAGAREWVTDGASVDAFVFGEVPESAQGSADAVLFIRALHNMARFSAERDFLGEAIDNAHSVLKPGGVVGVVQHAASPDMPDEWANGSAGYLKEQYVIDAFTARGFELVARSDINKNPNDQPTAEDVVWRLPPSYMGVDEGDTEGRAARDEIGESNRMTLLFKKSA